MKRFAVILFMLFGNCLGMIMVLDNDEENDKEFIVSGNDDDSDKESIVSDNDDDSDNESIGYSDEQDVKIASINKALGIIIPRIRIIQANAVHNLNSLPIPRDMIAVARFNRYKNILKRSHELEDYLTLSMLEYRNSVISFEVLLDDLDDVSADVTMILLDNNWGEFN